MKPEIETVLKEMINSFLEAHPDFEEKEGVILKEIVIGNFEYNYDEFLQQVGGFLDGYGFDFDSEWAKKNGLELLDGKFGAEDGGSECFMVFTWRGTPYFVDFSYYSYDGENWDGASDNMAEAESFVQTAWRRKAS